MQSEKVRKNKWYVVYEENLFKPVCLRYPFKEEIFAIAYVAENMPSKRTIIVTGAELQEYGITEISTQSQHLKNKVKRAKNDFQTQYYFNPDLPTQRKKTLRTIYRRRYKRNLKRLIHAKRSNTGN